MQKITRGRYAVLHLTVFFFLRACYYLVEINLLDWQVQGILFCRLLFHAFVASKLIFLPQ